MWAETFRNQPDLSGVVQSYQELKNKGIEFPAPELESVVPIYTPQRVSAIVTKETLLFLSVARQLDYCDYELILFSDTFPR